MDVAQALAFVREHGVVLVSARGPVPALTDAIAGAPVKGSWWSHPEGKHIFALLEQVCADADILVCRLVGAKVTLVHRRLWPALAAAAQSCPQAFPPSRLCKVTQEHTASGRHRNRESAFADWVTPDVVEEARSIACADALAALGPWAQAMAPAALAS